MGRKMIQDYTSLAGLHDVAATIPIMHTVALNLLKSNSRVSDIFLWALLYKVGLQCIGMHK